MNQPLLWGGFLLFVAAMLCLDLFLFNKKSHEVGFKEAIGFSIFWISLALLFNVGVYYEYGHQKAMEFLAGYLIEESLSVDNLFVFILIFTYFNVPRQYQHKILFWGIIGAVIMRMIFILAGVTLINRFHWIIYIFGVFLVYTGFKMAFGKDSEIDPEKNPVLRLARRFLPVSQGHHGDKFFVRIDGRRWVTPLFIVLLVVETTDVVFAVDSIPAVLAISHDPFIVFTSNIFAVLGLRSLYFALSGMVQLFHYLKYGLSFVLTFVGIKMLVSHFYKIPTGAALGVVGGILGISIFCSFLFPKKENIT